MPTSGRHNPYAAKSNLHGPVSQQSVRFSGLNCKKLDVMAKRTFQTIGEVRIWPEVKAMEKIMPPERIRSTM